MIIRCPQCEHTRSISESKIPPGAELATCPKCKHRFRFRSVRPALDGPEPQAAQGPPPAPEPQAPPIPAQPVIRPQEAFREAAEQNDIWEAMDALNRRWQSQLEQHVTEVETPRPGAGPAARKDAGRALPLSSARENAAPRPEPPVAAKGKADSAAPPPSAQAPLPGAPPPAAKVKTDSAAPRETPAAPSAQAPLLGAPPAPPRAAPSAQAPPPAAPTPLAGSSPQPAPPLTPETDGQSREQGAQAVFPYTDDGPAPEERVAQDMRMLREAASSGPLRDLGRLREFPESAAEGDEAPVLNSFDAPWENASGLGWFSAFADTVRGVMFDGPAFFSAFSGAGSLAPGYLFFVILGYLSILSSLLWSRAAEALLPGAPSLFYSRVSLPMLLLLAPVALGLMQLFVTGWIRLCLRLTAPDKADFGLVYKIVSYSVAPFVLSIVPFIGPPLGALWFLAALVIGCRSGLGLPKVLALAVPLPPALLLLGGITWYFL